MMKEIAKSTGERRRREYLALMGIQPWYARVEFKNARPSPVYPELLETVAQEQPAPRQDRALPSAREMATAAVAPKEKPIREPAHKPEDILRKPLHYLRLDESLALLVEDAWEGADGAECRDLLTNILKALGKSVDGGATGEIAYLNRRSAKAGAGQGALLEDLCRRDRCPNLLIFAFNGSELFPRVASSTADFTREIGKVSVRVTVTRGLREMLAFPDLKKFCWQDLQRLRARLR